VSCLLAAALAVAGCDRQGSYETFGPSSKAWDTANFEARRLSIEDSGPVPRVLTLPKRKAVVLKGTDIEVTNRDSRAHTISSDRPGEFDSGTITPGETVFLRVSGTGVFPYHCEIHPGLRGTIVINP
jgi:hypothetical protein